MTEIARNKISPEYIEKMQERHKIYQLDTFDTALDFLVDEFLEAGRGDLAHVWTSLRLQMHLHTQVIGVEETDRAIRFSDVYEKVKKQQDRALEMLINREEV